VRVEALPVKCPAHGPQIALLEVSPVIDLGHTQTDGLAQGAGGDSCSPVQEERELDLPMDLREPAQVEILRPINLDMDVADAHGQEVDPGGRDEPCCQAWVGPASAPLPCPATPEGSSPTSASTATPWASARRASAETRST